MNDQLRNINPTPEALIAMFIWGKEYADFGGGSMDFFDSLSIGRQRQCTMEYERLKAAMLHHQRNLELAVS